MGDARSSMSLLTHEGDDMHRLVQQPDGTWHATAIVTLEVNPVGFTRDATGHLMLLARNTEQLGDSSVPLACPRHPSYVVVRVDDDGRVVAMPDER